MHIFFLKLCLTSPPRFEIHNIQDKLIISYFVILFYRHTIFINSMQFFFEIKRFLTLHCEEG
jgi:hypothetical protein